MLAEYIKPKQKVVYWSPTLNRYVVAGVKKKNPANVILDNDVQLTYKKILCIQGV